MPDVRKDVEEIKKDGSIDIRFKKMEWKDLIGKRTVMFDEFGRNPFVLKISNVVCYGKGRDEEPIFEIDENQSENHLRMILGKCRKEGIPIATYKRKSE